MAGFGCLVISGASRGLGAALAERFAAPGVTLRLLARTESGLAETAERCTARGAMVETAALDVRDGATVVLVTMSAAEPARAASNAAASPNRPLPMWMS